MDTQAELQWLLDQIKALADSQYQAGSTMVMKSQLVIYGVRVPDLRSIAKDWQQTHKDVSWEEVLALVEALWASQSQEERALAIMLLARYPRRLPDLTWDHIDRWRRQLDNWGLTDGLGTVVVGPWLMADLDTRVGRLGDLVVDQDLWSRRLALVATVPINRRDPEHAIPDFTLSLIDQVKLERHPMITKAVSWALREMTKTCPERVLAYVDANRGVLAAHVVREVENKLRTGLKSGRTR